MKIIDFSRFFGFRMAPSWLKWEKKYTKSFQAGTKLAQVGRKLGFFSRNTGFGMENAGFWPEIADLGAEMVAESGPHSEILQNQ